MPNSIIVNSSLSLSPAPLLCLSMGCSTLDLAFCFVTFQKVVAFQIIFSTLSHKYLGHFSLSMLHYILQITFIEFPRNHPNVVILFLPSQARICHKVN